MLDKNTLNKCAFVSQHWAALAQQVKTDLSTHIFIQDQIAFLQVQYFLSGRGCTRNQPRVLVEVGLTVSLLVQLADPYLVSCPTPTAS